MASTDTDSTKLSPLDMPELLPLVFEHLHHDRPSLARAARVCKAWSDQALKVLWAGPIWADQLKSVLSEQTTSLTPFGLSLGKKLRVNQGMLLRVPTAEETERLQHYAGLVEHLRVDGSGALQLFASSRVTFPRLKVLEAQPAILPEDILSFTPLCGPSINRVLLKLNVYDDTFYDDEEDDEDPGEMPEAADIAWGHADQHDTALSFSLINLICQNCPNLTDLDICLSRRVSASFFPLLAPLRKTLQRLVVTQYNMKAALRYPNPFRLDGLKALNGFTALECLELRLSDVRATTKKAPMLPALKTVVLSDLVTSHINLVLPLLPITLKSVSLFGIVPSLAVGKTRPTNALTLNLRRLASLETLHIFSYHAFPKTRNSKADLELQNAVARLVLGKAFKNLSSFFINVGRSELPRVALGQLARAVPTLKHFGVATQNLTDRELKEVAVALPELESLAIAPWLKTNLSTGEWKFVHMKRFGEVCSELHADPGNGRCALPEVIYRHPDFLPRFPIDCIFEPMHMQCDHYKFNSHLTTFLDAVRDRYRVPGEENEENEDELEDQYGAGDIFIDDIYSMFLDHLGLGMGGGAGHAVEGQGHGGGATQAAEGATGGQSEGAGGGGGGGGGTSLPGSGSYTFSFLGGGGGGGGGLQMIPLGSLFLGPTAPAPAQSQGNDVSELD